MFSEMSFVPVFDHYRGAVPLMRCCSTAFLGDARSPLSHTNSAQRKRSSEPPWLQIGKRLVQREVEAQRAAYKATVWWHRCRWKHLGNIFKIG